MRIFFDTNVLLDVALRRKPFYEQSLAVLKDAIENYVCFLSWHTVSNLSYLLGKLETIESALTFIQEIPAGHRSVPQSKRSAQTVIP